MQTRKVRVTPLGRSMEGTRWLDKMSYRVAMSEGGANSVIEARITLGSLERLTEPEKRIEELFATGPLPEPNIIVDIAV
jgi:hypothetical protein